MLPFCSDLSSQSPHVETLQLGETTKQSQKNPNPQPQIHCRMQGQRFFIHFNLLTAQSKPCQQHQVAKRNDQN